MKKIILTTGLGLLLSSSLFASEENKFYAGFNIGKAEANTTVNIGTATLDEKDTAWKVYSGYKFNNYFSAELFYADLGEGSLSGNNGDTFTYSGTTYNFIVDGASIATESKSLGLNFVASYPINKYFEPFAKIGIHRWDVDMSVGASTIPTSSASDKGTDLVYGAGFDIPISKNLMFRAEWERFEMDPSLQGIKTMEEIEFLSVGIAYKF